MKTHKKRKQPPYHVSTFTPNALSKLPFLYNNNACNLNICFIQPRPRRPRLGPGKGGGWSSARRDSPHRLGCARESHGRETSQNNFARGNNHLINCTSQTDQPSRGAAGQPRGDSKYRQLQNDFSCESKPADTKRPPRPRPPPNTKYSF